MPSASFAFAPLAQGYRLALVGDWYLGSAPQGAELCSQAPESTKTLQLDCSQLGHWDSSLSAALLQLARWCEQRHIQLETREAPVGLQQLLGLSTAIAAYKTTSTQPAEHWFIRLQRKIGEATLGLKDSLIFIGDVCLALKAWLAGRAKTRSLDIGFFIDQAGPRALAIVTLISLLVGMILAYLGSVQLRQMGAQVYVANLVALGMVREMGALMTAVIMAGRTGAAYAAQLGTMQVNEEIDALRVMGISSMEFLVLPRLLALVLVMPLLCIYANIIGMIGGALVATSMDVGFKMYILQTQDAVDWVDISTGLVKSLVFGILIAIAGCRAGLNCGRDSTAVGMATTNAVVSAIVYLVVADAAFNILYDKLGI